MTMYVLCVGLIYENTCSILWHIPTLQVETEKQMLKAVMERSVQDATVCKEMGGGINMIFYSLK